MACANMATADENADDGDDYDDDDDHDDDDDNDHDHDDDGVDDDDNEREHEHEHDHKRTMMRTRVRIECEPTELPSNIERNQKCVKSCNHHHHRHHQHGTIMRNLSESNPKELTKGEEGRIASRCLRRIIRPSQETV